MKKSLAVFVALFFLALGAHAETMSETDAYNAGIAQRSGDGDYDQTPHKSKLKCPKKQYYNTDEQKCVGICHKVECYWKEHTPTPSSDGRSCCCK